MTGALGSSLMAELDAFADELGPELVPPGSTAAMAHAAAVFEAARPELAFEVHLERAPARVDLTVRVARSARAQIRGDRLPASARALIAAWSDPTSRCHAIPFVEFEFDLPEHGRAPWVGPAVEPALRSGPRAIQEQRDRGEGLNPALALEALDRLGPPLAAATRRRLSECFAALPRWGLIGQVARLDGRPSGPREGVRAFCSVPREHLRELLDRLGWPGSWAGLDAAIEALTPRAEWVDLDFGVADGALEIELGLYVEFWGPRASTSAVARTLAGLRDRSGHTWAAEAIAAWVAKVDGRPDRVLTVKQVFGGDRARTPKVYFSTLH